MTSIIRELLLHFFLGSFLGFISLCIWSVSSTVAQRKRHYQLVNTTLKCLAGIFLVGAFIGPLSNYSLLLAGPYLTILFIAILCSGVAITSY